MKSIVSPKPMSSIEQATQPSDELKHHHLFRLQTLAQEQAFWLGVEGVVVTDYAASIGQRVIEALNSGLTPAEILAALNEGEQRGLPISTREPPSADDPLTPDYWQAIQAEAEAFWESRSGFDSNEHFTD